MCDKYHKSHALANLLPRPSKLFLSHTISVTKVLSSFVSNFGNFRCVFKDHNTIGLWLL